MSTVLEIKTAVASYLKKTVADLTVNTQDLGLLAMNQVRRRAEMQFDFEFSRKLMTLTINALTGGSIDSAVVYGTNTVLEIKTLIEVGLFDERANLRPISWTTVAQSLEIQRQQQPGLLPRYPTDSQVNTAYCGIPRIVFSGSTAYLVPKGLTTETVALGFEAYTFQADWTTGSESDVWTTKGAEYMMWATVAQVNNLFKEFVPRQEGNLPPTDQQAAIALQAFRDWDTFKYEQFRRHE